MKPVELMIGNYIYLKHTYPDGISNKIITRVAYINPYAVECTDDLDNEEDNDDNYTEDYEAIPLTSEIIENFGFIRTNHINFEWILNKLTIYRHNDNTYTIVNREHDDVIHNITEVHKLQQALYMFGYYDCIINLDLNNI